MKAETRTALLSRNRRRAPNSMERVNILEDALRRIAANRGEAQAARTAAFALQRAGDKSGSKEEPRE